MKLRHKIYKDARVLGFVPADVCPMADCIMGTVRLHYRKKIESLLCWIDKETLNVGHPFYVVSVSDLKKKIENLFQEIKGGK